MTEEFRLTVAVIAIGLFIILCVLDWWFEK